MLDPGYLLTKLTDALISIPELQLPIKAYDENFPIRNDLMLAIWKMPVPSLLTVWRGDGPAGKGNMEVWSHTYSIILRADDQAGAEYSYFKLWWAISNGKVNGSGKSLRLCPVDPAVYPMDTPSITRQTLFISEQSRLDYHEVAININERGDA